MARPRGCMDAISQPAANGNRDTRSAGHDCRTASQPPDDHKRERVNKFRHNYCVDIRSDEVGRHIAWWPVTPRLVTTIAGAGGRAYRIAFGSQY